MSPTKIKFRFPQMGLRTALVLLVLAVLLPVLIVQGIIYAAWYDNRMDSNVQQNLAQAMAAQMNLDSFIQDVSRQEIALGDSVLRMEHDGLPAINQYLTASVAAYGGTVYSFHWADHKGDIIASSDPQALKTPPLSVADRSYYLELAKPRPGRDWSVGNLITGRASGRLTFMIARRMTDAAGQFRGILFASIQPEKLPIPETIRAGGLVTIFDDDGRLVYGSPPESAGPPGNTLWAQQDALLAKARSASDAQATGTVKSPVGGQMLVASRLHITTDPEWIVGVSVPQSQVAAPLLHSMAMAGALTGGAALLSAVAAVMIGRRIITGTRLLQEHARDIGQGKLDSRVEFVGLREINQLADSLNNMAQDLQAGRAALQESEERFRGLFETMNEGFLVGEPIYQNGRCVDFLVLAVNPAYYQHTGLKGLAGRRIKEFLPDLEQVWLDRYAHVAATGQPDHFEDYNAGTRRYYEVFIYSPQPGQFAVVFMDVTNRKQAEEAIRRAQQEAATLARFPSENPSPVLRVSREGTVLYHNAASQSLLDAWACGVGRTLPQAILGKVLQAARDNTVLEAEIAAGEQVFSFQVSPGSAGQDVNIYGRDVTERRRAQRALQQTAVRLERSNKELEQFAYSVSHDLRAPLRSINGFSQALLEDYHDKLDAEGQGFLARVRAASQRMGELIDDLLRLSRVTRQEMRLEEVDVSAIAHSLADDMAAASPGRKVEARIQPGMKARGDSQLLRVVLQNLLDNAWKFTGKTPSARVEVGSVQKEGRDVFFVRDNGAGFDMAYGNKLFAPFQRLHTESEFPGTGIGLATVQRIIYRHGGSVWAEGGVNQGAVFYFTLEGSA